ncbi:WGR domain-containing protein [Flavobacterium sp. RS13.1]|uniref:WGR domain-containing protein n=1 Tax=Flavobacterium sp. RS13.1 TaxID=3400345 RepID=UPI003AAF539C
MKKHLKYIDGNSDKFWQIEASGLEFTVTYGKNGTSGTSQTKSFSSPEECLKAAEKILAEKTKKGYSETGEVVVTASSGVKTASNSKSSDTAAILEEYDSIVTSKKSN